MTSKQTNAAKNLEEQIGDLKNLMDMNTPVKKQNATVSDDYLSEDDAELEKLARENDVKLLEYRKEQYQKFKTSTYELVVKPMIMAASVAFGLSLGYSIFDFVALRFKRSK